MNKVKFVPLAIIVVALAVSAFMSPRQAAGQPLGGRPLTAILTGAEEVIPGDPDGSGLADLALNSGQEQICFELKVENIAAPTRAHIHAAPAGVNGPIVVTFFDVVVNPPVPVWTWPHETGHIWEPVVPHLPTRTLDFQGVANG